MNVASFAVLWGPWSCRNVLVFIVHWISVKEVWGRILRYPKDWIKHFEDHKAGKMMIFLELILQKLPAGDE